MLAAPIPRDTLVPAELVLDSLQDADLVELPVQADPGDMAEGLRPGDRVQVLAAYTDGSRRGRAVALLNGAEVVRVLDEADGLTGPGRHTGVRGNSWCPGCWTAKENAKAQRRPDRKRETD